MNLRGWITKYSSMRYVLTVIAVVISFLCLAFAGYYVKIHSAEADFAVHYSALTYAPENRSDEEAQMTKAMEMEFLPLEDKGYAAAALFVMKDLEGNLDQAITWGCESIYYFQEAGDDVSATVQAVNLSMLLNDYGDVESAESWLQDIDKRFLAFTEKGVCSQSDSQYQRAYIASDLAEINLGLGHYQKALEYIELSDDLMKACGYSDYEDYFLNALNLLRIRAYACLGSWDEAESLFERIEAPDEAGCSDKYSALNELMPYYAAHSEILAHRGEYLDSRRACLIYTDVCDLYGLDSYKWKYLEEYITVIDAENLSDDTHFEDLDDLLLKAYRDQMASNARSIGNVVSNIYLYSVENLEQHKRSEDMIHGMLVMIVAGLLVIIVSIAGINLSLVSGRKDPLTGIGNRRAFNEHFDHVKRSKKPYYIMMMDIDDFKVCNDTYGHEFGDQVLAAIGGILKKMENGSFTPFRYGGEEFCVFYTTDYENGVIFIAERVRREVEALVWDNGYRATISIGIAKSGEDKDALNEADENLYNSKRNGKNCVSFNQRIVEKRTFRRQ